MAKDNYYDSSKQEEELLPIQKLILISAFAFFSFCLLFGFAGAATCNTTNNIINSSSISNSCTLDTSGSYFFQTGNYNINGSNSITLNANNILIDFNGSTVYGNSTTDTNSRGISMSSRTNITLINGILHNFREGMRYTTGVNLTVFNMTINNTRSGIFFITSSTGLNVSYSNIYDALVGGVYVQASRNVLIDNSYFNNATVYIEKSAALSQNITVSRNIFDRRTFQTAGIDQEKFQVALGNVSNTFILENNFINTSRGFGAVYVTVGSNILIKDNNFSWNDRAVSFESGYGNNITIEDNYFNNSLTHEDVYDNPLNIVGSRLIGSYKWTNLTIQRNTFNNFGCVGMALRDIDGAYIINNSFSQDYNFILGFNFQCSNEPLTGIMIQEIYKGFIPAGTVGSDNYSIASNHTSNNITILGNTFNNINVLLRTQGTSNLTHDLTNFWFKSWQLPFSLDIDKFYISNSFNNISGILPAGSLTTSLKQGINNNWQVNYSIFTEYSFFKNVNTSDRDVNLYNQTNSLIYFSNGSVACSNIENCDNNINISLSPLNYSYVLDNFNLTEGITRQFSPLSISGTSTSKTITSSLSQSINATVVVNANCDSQIEGRYQGIKVMSVSCEGNTATFNLENIPSGASILELIPIDINCSSNTSASVIIILVFSALAIVALTFILIEKFKEGEFDIKILIIVFIAIIVGLVLFTQIAELTGGVCTS